ncbi:MAG: sigma 54-interacting transcriptional regulator, partial [Deltaproteobacteria bacterium]|nr:sigma 54-interacting transcriptional regulator [Deltaproteobacteria bacterium]
DLALPVQAKLLRTLESGEIRPVGSDHVHRVDVRMIAATHKDLARGVADGWFREDLYHRLAVCVVRAPALREHPEDLLAITAHILGQLSRDAGRTYAPVPEPVARLWQAYHWPGNVRELRNLLTRAVLDASGLDLPPHALVPDLTSTHVSPGFAQSRTSESASALSVELVQRAIVAESGNRVRAAKRLGISRSTLYRYMGMQADGTDQCD